MEVRDRKTNLPLSHKTIKIQIDYEEFFEVLTDQEGKASLLVPFSTSKLTFQIIENYDDHDDDTDPTFTIHEACTDSLTDTQVEVLEKLYSFDFVVAHCRDSLRHFADVPIKLKSQGSSDEIIFSDERGIVHLRLPKTATAVELTILDNTSPMTILHTQSVSSNYRYIV